MALKSNELRREAGNIGKEMLDLQKQAESNKGEWTQEQADKFDSLGDLRDQKLKAAEREERAEKIAIESNEFMDAQTASYKHGDIAPEKKKDAEMLAIKSYLKYGVVPDELQGVMKPSSETDDKNFIQKEMDKLGITRAAQQSTSVASGGYTIPAGFQAELEVAVQAFGGMFEASRVWKTDMGNAVTWPTVNDTTVSGYLLSEATSAETSATKITDSSQTFNAYKYTSGLVRVSSELFDDSAFNMGQVLIDLLSIRLFRGLNAAFTTANGSSKPNGVVTAATYAGSLASSSAITAAEVLAIQHEVDPGYRGAGMNARYMFNDATLKVLRGLTVASGDNRPLWQPDLAAGAKDTILGMPYTVNQDIASLGVSAVPILFGAFSKYIIRQVKNMRIVRLNERFADTDEVGFVVFGRFDGDLLDAGTHPIIKYRCPGT